MKTSRGKSIVMFGFMTVAMAAYAGEQSSGKVVDKAEMKMNRSQAKSGSSTTMADGEVEDVDIGSKSITLKHGPIKSKTIEMEPMTMPFAVTDAKLLSGVKAGDKVKFSAEYIDDEVRKCCVMPRHYSDENLRQYAASVPGEGATLRE